MRVISGKLGGQNFDAPKGHKTHPMSEKARGALFSVLGDINGLAVLDAFAGSGALAIEAISRGASQAVAVDSDRKAHEVILNNTKKLGIEDKVKAIKANAGSWSDNNTDKKFDLVFVSPPYDNIQLSIIKKMVRHVKRGGLLVLDWPGNADVPSLEPLRLHSVKKYGDAKLAFYIF